MLNGQKYPPLPGIFIKMSCRPIEFYTKDFWITGIYPKGKTKRPVPTELVTGRFYFELGYSAYGKIPSSA